MNKYKAKTFFAVVTLMLLPNFSQAATLFSESFENASYSARGWYDNTSHGTIVTNCGQAGNCLQWAWAQGATNPTNGGAMRKAFTPTDSMMVTFYVKFQNGWRGSQKAYHPHMIGILSDLDGEWAGPALSYLDTYIEFLSDVGGSYSIRPMLAIQDSLRVNFSYGTPPNNISATTENRSVGPCNSPAPAGNVDALCYNYDGTNYYSALTWRNSNTSISTNSWHKVEAYFKMNTINAGKGQSDGVLKEWIDGTPVLNYSNVMYRTNQDPTKKWAQFVLMPYIGDTSPIAQTMWLDELSVGTTNPYDTTDTTPPSVPTGLAVQ